MYYPLPEEGEQGADHVVVVGLALIGGSTLNGLEPPCPQTDVLHGPTANVKLESLRLLT
jgi:hypothetical protein